MSYTKLDSLLVNTVEGNSFHKPRGYVILEDGRALMFFGIVDDERIRLAAEAALAGEHLPDGFRFEIELLEPLTDEDIESFRATMVRLSEQYPGLGSPLYRSNHRRFRY